MLHVARHLKINIRQDIKPLTHRSGMPCCMCHVKSVCMYERFHLSDVLFQMVCHVWCATLVWNWPNYSGLLTPDSAFIMALTAAATPPSLKVTVNLTHFKSSTQVISQPPKDTPTSVPISLVPSSVQSSPFLTSSSLITTLQPYYPPPHSTTSLHTTPFSSHPHPSTISTSTNLVRSLFCPGKLDRFFVIPPTTPNSVNTLLICQCLEKQVGKVSFCNCPDCPHLVTVALKTMHYLP